MKIEQVTTDRGSRFCASHPLAELLHELHRAEPGTAFDVSDLPLECRWEERYFEEQLFELGIRVRVARLDSARTPQSYRITVLS